MKSYLAASFFALALLAACAPPQPEAQQAASTPPPADAPASAAMAGDLVALKSTIEKTMPGVKIDHIQTTPVPGLYELQVGMNFGYVSADGRYLIAGDLTDLQTQKTLTEDRRRTARLALLSGLNNDNTIEFAPEKPAAYTVTVFTDVDCGYCRKLHQQIAQYNAEGIAVRYAFFPRSGPNTESFEVAEQVWCSADRKQALTQAKLGTPLQAPKDCQNPVMRDWEISGELGLRGTPSIILPNGDLVPGYQTPAELLEVLKAQGNAKS